MPLLDLGCVDANWVGVGCAVVGYLGICSVHVCHVDMFHSCSSVGLLGLGMLAYVLQV